MPNKRSNVSLKLLACDLPIAFQSLTAEDQKIAVDGFLQLNWEQQERIVKQFDLKRISKDAKLSKSAAGLVQILIQRQVSKSKHNKVSVLGTSNALIAVQSYNLNIEQSIRLIIEKPDGSQFL